MKLNLPNLLTVSRVVITPLFLVTILMETLPHRFLIACVIFSVASITDAVDGHLARKNNMITLDNVMEFGQPTTDGIFKFEKSFII